MSLLFALLLLAPLQERRAEAELDEVHMTDGKVLTGQVAFEDEQVVILRNKSKEKSYDLADVEQVDSRVRALREVLRQIDESGPAVVADGSKLLELAEYAEHSRLPGEASLLRTFALIADPLDTAAGEALGAKLRKGTWQIPYGRKTRALDELVETERKWKTRVTLDSAHYRVVSNLPLGDIVRATLDLERMYAAFYEVFALELTLLEPAEIMEVQLHADLASFPQPGSGRDGDFSAEDRIARALVDRYPWRYQVTHEAVRQLFFYTTRRATNARGTMPRWVSAGVSEALATGLNGKSGFTTYDMASVDRSRFRIHARADRPMDIDRVLVITPPDLTAHKDQHLMYAQCYTLVHFLMYGADDEQRGAFMDYLREAYRGKASPSRFKKQLGDIDALNEEWLAYVREKSGL